MPTVRVKSPAVPDSPKGSRTKSTNQSMESQAARLRTARDTLPKCPVPLSKEEAVIYEHIINSRERESWTGNDLYLCGILAKNYKRLRDLERVLVKSSDLVQVGSQGAGPAAEFLVYNRLIATIRSLVNCLGLSATGTGASSPEQKKRSRAEAATRKLMEDLEAETDLI